MNEIQRDVASPCHLSRNVDVVVVIDICKGLNIYLWLLVVVKRSSGNGCITSSCNENSATYRTGILHAFGPIIRFIHCHVQVLVILLEYHQKVDLFH